VSPLFASLTNPLIVAYFGGSPFEKPDSEIRAENMKVKIRNLVVI
jgi:hypothetical protein